MRALARISSHRVLFAVALLAPVVLFAALAWSSWIVVGGLQHAYAARQIDRARDEVAALVRLDRVVLGEVRARLPPASAPGRPARAWLAGAALPPRARRDGGIVALFVADAAGVLRPLGPAAGGGRPVAGTLQGRRLFARLRRGAAMAIGTVCPVATAGGPVMPGRGFVLAEPLAAGAASPRGEPTRGAPRGPAAVGTQRGSTSFRGVIGACIAPQALTTAWRARLPPADTLRLAGAGGRPLLQVGGDGRSPWPGAAGARSEPVAHTPLRVVLTPTPSARWRAWYPVAWIAALLALAVGLALAAAARAARHQQRTAQALATAERFADVLRLRGERYRQLFLSAPAAMHALDSSWRIVAVNDRWLSLFGYRREEVVGRRFETCVAPGARTAAAQAWTRLLAGDEPQPTRLRMLHRDGTELELTLRVQAERDPDGRLRQAFALLGEPAAALAAPEPGRPDLLARVAGGVAHDFNNLLMVVMGSLERLGAQADRPDTVRRLAGMALAAAERGAGLTARLLAAAGRQPLRPELVNANRLLREAAEAIAQTAGPKVEVQFLLSPLLDPARIDPTQFRTALLALVANAREAMPRGGRLSIETANLAGPTPPQGRIVISLSDTGTGMDATVLARATEPFFTTRPPGQASGLGLSVADGFARQSGGSLEIESEPGVGSTVRLLLPRSADLAPSAPPTGVRPALPAGEGPSSRPTHAGEAPVPEPPHSPARRHGMRPTQGSRQIV